MTTKTLIPAEISEDDINAWFEAEDYLTTTLKLSDEQISEKYTETQIRIVRSSVDFTLHTLTSALKDRSYLNLAPDYQRRNRWDKRKKSLLIESFLMNIPIPPLFLFEKDYNQYEIMDGRQRLESITEFLDNKFALTGLEFWPELQGRRFKELPGVIQRGLLRRSINAVVLLAETFKSNDIFDIRLILFRRLNTGGVKLNPQELRNALYPGNFNKALHELSREDIFTKVWRIPKKTSDEEESPSQELQNNVLYRSMMDCELVLRFFAIRDAANDLAKGTLRHILDRTMQSYSTAKDAQITVMKEDFLNALTRVTKVLGDNFHVLPETSRPSRPLYDALLVAADALPNIDISADSRAIHARLDAALNDPISYGKIIGRENTHESIKDRVAIAKSILAG